VDEYSSIRTLNQTLAKGQMASWRKGARRLPDLPPDRPLYYPQIGVYRGKGASHSWLWFVDVLERMGFYDLSFPDESCIQENVLDRMDVLAVSGGDTLGIAKGLGRAGASKLARFIRGGGLYLGSCAGAYLPLHSSKEHLNLFNFVPVKIANLTQALPEARGLREKFCTAYGCAYVFHPVREAVMLRSGGFAPFQYARSFAAPLYGGPPMIAPDPDMVAATYAGFTPKTLFLADETIARETLLGRAAVIRAAFGLGHFHLYGPHCEHPKFPLANTLLAKALYWDLPSTQAGPRHTDADFKTVLSGASARSLLRNIRREISNARIVAAGMETLPIRWRIGEKIYEAGKIRVFLEAIWARIPNLERSDPIAFTQGLDKQLIERLPLITALVRQIRRGVDLGTDTKGLAKDLFANLNEVSALFLEMYFQTQRWLFGGRNEA
jgi:hypothetical protein